MQLWYAARLCEGARTGLTNLLNQVAGYRVVKDCDPLYPHVSHEPNNRPQDTRDRSGLKEDVCGSCGNGMR
jgi:hypothetical protein